MYKLGVIGAGNMGMAILDGAMAANVLHAEDVAVFDLSEQRIVLCKERGFHVLQGEAEVFSQSEVVLFAVKPQNFGSLLQKLSGVKPCDGQIVLTIAAGVSIGYLMRFLPYSKKIVRALPNTPLMLGLGATALAKTDDVSEEEFKKVAVLFSAAGEVAEIPENKMNEIIPVNGSSPAFVYYFIDAIAKSAEKMGVDYQTALRLAAKTFIGSAEMMMRSGRTAEDLIEEVCSPGGTTIEAIRVFDEKGMRNIIDEACVKCTKRAYEIGK